MGFDKTGGGAWVPDADVADKLESFYDVSGNLTGWKFTDANGDFVENYDATGKLTSIVNRAGLTQTLTYNASGFVNQVTDSFGRTLTFAYSSAYITADQLVSVTNPAGGVYTYTYDTNGHLSTVQYPDTKVKTYHYSADPNADQMTAIIDENSQTYATWTYDGQWKVATSRLAGGANLVTLNATDYVTTTVTNAFGALSTYKSSVILGVNRIINITGQVCPGCGPAVATFSATNGTPTSKTDWKGNRTNYVYDARLLQTSRTEGLTSGGAVVAGVTRTITTAWHATFRLPTLITEKNDAGTTLRTTTMTYDANGNMLTRTVADPIASKSRTWTYTYNANGQVLTIDGPRTDLTDVTTFTYYANNDADLGKRAGVATITNALGQTTQITAYDANGLPLTLIDPNGLTVTLTYDLRQRLTSRTAGGETTTYTYDNAGQLTKVTLPDASYLSYTYDAAHRLTQITDNLGNKIVYTLDAMSNRTQEQVFDPSATLTQTKSRVYSTLNRLTQEIGAASQTTAYVYDNQGNVTSVDGPLTGTGDTTTFLYDALNRLTRMTDPNAGQVNYGINSLDQMLTLKDPRNFTTTYTMDALNNRVQLTSPDTGVTQNTYDNAGNLLTQLDAKGQTTTYTYDALNRVASISYTTDPSLNVTFTYDAGTYGLGRLTGIADSTGTIGYVYTVHGRLASESRVIGGVTYTTSYTYDAAGRLATMTYPGGRQITYTRDGLGRISDISTTKGMITDTLVTGAAYQPFGPEKTFTFGNSQVYTRGFDQDGRVATFVQQPGQTMAVGYDAASRITAITDVGTPSNILTYNYDLLDRVTSFTAPAFSLSQAFGYDAVGNRTSQTIGAVPYASVYGVTNNRIATTAGPVAKVFTSDANGSITNDLVNTYTFDARGRMKQATTVAGTSQFLVNTLGQRVKKSVGGIDTVFHYDSGGRLIGETDAAGNVTQEYVYLNDIPVAVYK